MVIKNLSQKTILSPECRIAKSISDSLLGLLKKDIDSLLLQTRFGIHTFGLSQDIDVIVLNHNWEVVKLKLSLKPNRLFFWNPAFNLIIELPKGAIEKSKTVIGDQLTKSPPV